MQQAHPNNRGHDAIFQHRVLGPNQQQLPEDFQVRHQHSVQLGGDLRQPDHRHADLPELLQPVYTFDSEADC